MKFPTPPAGMTEAEMDAVIEEALVQSVKDGVIVDTGKTQWSERTQRMMPVYMRVPPAKEHYQRDSPILHRWRVGSAPNVPVRHRLSCRLYRHGDGAKRDLESNR
jgi:hypothetical protein